MAIFSYMMGARVSRAAEQSAVKVAAYRAREKLRDERTGCSYNHRPRERGRDAHLRRPTHSRRRQDLLAESARASENILERMVVPQSSSST
jgi:hypothetical protein